MTTISFNEISSTQRKPAFLAEVEAQALTTPVSTPAKILFVGQKLASGSATANTVSPVITSQEHAASLFGYGSMLHRMLGAALYCDTRSYFYAMPVADASGAAYAQGQIVVTGTATESNTERLYLAADKNVGKINVPIVSGDDADDVAAAIRTAVNTYGAELSSGALSIGSWYEITARDSVDFTADGAASNTVGQVFRASSATVTLTASDKVKPVTNKYAALAYILTGATSTVKFIAKHPGLQGNNIDIRMNYYGPEGGENSTAGISLAVTQPSSGTSDPDLTTAVAALAGLQFNYIACPYTDTSNLDLWDALMGTNWNANVAINGHVFSSKEASFADLSTFGDARNGAHQTTIGTTGSLADPAVVCASVASVVGAELNEHPARPVQNLRVKSLYAPSESDRLTSSEMNLLYFDGVSQLDVLPDGGVRTDRIITHYQLTSAGSESTRWLDVMVPACAAHYRAYMVSRMEDNYPRSILVTNSTPVGEGGIVVKPKNIKALFESAYDTLVSLGICQDPDSFAKTLVVEIDSTDKNRVNVLAKPIFAGGLIVGAIKIEFA